MGGCVGAGKREMFCIDGNDLHIGCKGVQHALVKRVHGSRFTVEERKICLVSGGRIFVHECSPLLNPCGCPKADVLRGRRIDTNKNNDNSSFPLSSLIHRPTDSQIHRLILHSDLWNRAWFAEEEMEAG
jgi:hypothetical protein